MKKQDMENLVMYFEAISECASKAKKDLEELRNSFCSALGRDVDPQTSKLIDYWIVRFDDAAHECGNCDTVVKGELYRLYCAVEEEGGEK